MSGHIKGGLSSVAEVNLALLKLAMECNNRKQKTRRSYAAIHKLATISDCLETLTKCNK